MPIAEIQTVSTAFKVALDLARGAKAAADAIDNAEIKFKLAELYSALADAKMAAADAQEAIDAKDREIERLKQQFRRAMDDTVEVKGVRYRKGADGKPVGYPFCPRCLEVDGLLIATTMAPGERGNKACPQCKANYKHDLLNYPDP